MKTAKKCTLRLALYLGAHVIESDECEGRGYAFVKFDGTKVAAWRTKGAAASEMDSIAKQLRAAGVEVTIEEAHQSTTPPQKVDWASKTAVIQSLFLDL